ncbi:MAG: hypothetical protein JO206_14280 [Solirubrobacterales bacterium]|nr:hypothetical protein [Solirubrobacterales bacterium]MBV9474132.1 hypothetical protein [Solirubrobacterales bacterium]
MPEAPHRSACAFIVLAHRQPGQVLRLIRRLSPSPVFVHVDARASAATYEPLLRAAEREKSFELLPRVRSGWGSWGIVAAALGGLRAVRRLAADHVAILSGQDYPLVAVERIQGFSRQHPDLSFVATWPVPTPLWDRDGGAYRIRYWHQPVRGRRLFVPLPRRFPHGLTPFGGSLYCMLARSAVDAVLELVERRPDVVRFYRHAWIPDEMFIPTVLLNSLSPDRIINEHLWYMDWSGSDARHPKLLVSEDAEALINTAGKESDAGGPGRAKLFARKFAADVDRHVLDVLDQHALRA